MLIHVPIEPIERRYSKQWREWIPEAFEIFGVKQLVIDPEISLNDNQIQTGSFLDAHGTIYYKSLQNALIIKALYEGKITDGDILFFYDLWFPGIEGLKYAIELSGKNIKIAGILHAGTWDKHDLLSKTLSEWAGSFEKTIFSLADYIFVATKFHKDLILEHGAVNEAKEAEQKIHIVPHPFRFKDLDQYLTEEKEDQIVFPHRLADEKNPDHFEKLKNFWESKSHKELEFVVTQKECKSKEDYYRTLAKSRVAISFAEQETFGISMLEAAYLGCVCIVPNNLCYQEVNYYVKSYQASLMSNFEENNILKLINTALLVQNDSSASEFHKKQRALLFSRYWYLSTLLKVKEILGL